MVIDSKGFVLPNDSADCRQPFFKLFRGLCGVVPNFKSADSRFDSTEPFLYQFSSVCFVAVGLAPDFIAHLAAQKFIHGNPQYFPFYIPDCLVNSADGGTVDKTALPKAVAVHFLID